MRQSSGRGQKRAGRPGRLPVFAWPSRTLWPNNLGNRARVRLLVSRCLSDGLGAPRSTVPMNSTIVHFPGMEYLASW
jgi:hypothetical protein